MKRDVNLVREILLAVEISEPGTIPDGLQIDGYSDELIGSQVFVMCEGKLLALIDERVKLDPTNWTIIKAFAKMPVRLTWRGHEFIDAARDETRWKKAMEATKKHGETVSIGVLMELLGTLAFQQALSL